MSTLTKKLSSFISILVRGRLYTTEIKVKNSSYSLIAEEENAHNSEENTLTCVCDNDLSIFTPSIPPAFNVAAYINKSKGLQKLVALNVNLSKIEKKPHVLKKLLWLDFEKDIKKYIFFLKDYVQKDNLGAFITKNPEILFESIEDLQVRINYLQSKNFSKTQVQRIIDRNPFWLSFSTVRIDRRLGYFQNKFSLTGPELRALATSLPKLITHKLHKVNTNTFVVLEELGFNNQEVKSLLLQKPKLWLMNQLALIRRFNYIHNSMKISHEDILKSPGILLSREFRIRQRHTFLSQLNRAQYDSTKENYVPIIALAEGTDVDFCKKYAKCTVDDFNLFLKTI